ncbi:MAG TPA: zinc-binding alcohol dehydrogenase family protein [Burkholderiales bacterium]|nr:zinc-binding alcohol dehydrogenase family protein [Burkholderiales bacterium]
MKAVAHTRPLPITDAAALIDIELPKPVPGPRDLLVRVEAISVNPVDTKRRKDASKADDKPRVLGWDAAGVVEAVGAQVTLFKPGDAVYYAGDVTRPGANSELHAVDERIVGRKPKSLDFAQAAAIPLTAITAWESLFDLMKVQAGKSLLVIGGAGGVGSMGIQLAKIAGLEVIATASRPETIAWCRELGADHVVDHRKPLPAQLAALDRKGVDYIANFSGDLDAYWDAMAEMIAPFGRMVAIVGNARPLASDVVRAKSVTFSWEFMFTRSRFQAPDMIEQHRLLGQVADWLDSGKLQGTLKETLSPINAANLRAAHARLESGTMIGKLVLKGWS